MDGCLPHFRRLLGSDRPSLALLCAADALQLWNRDCHDEEPEVQRVNLRLRLGSGGEEER